MACTRSVCLRLPSPGRDSRTAACRSLSDHTRSLSASRRRMSATEGPSMTTDTHPGELRVLVLGASVRSHSVNARLATLTAQLVSDAGATVDLATLRDFDMPLYDGDMEEADGLP